MVYKLIIWEVLKKVWVGTTPTPPMVVLGLMDAPIWVFTGTQFRQNITFIIECSGLELTYIPYFNQIGEFIFSLPFFDYRILRPQTKKFLCQILPKEINSLSHNIITKYQVVIKLFKKLSRGTQG